MRESLTPPQEPSRSPLRCEKDHKGLCSGSSTERLSSSILLVSRRFSPTHSKHLTQTMAIKSLLVLLPLQSLLLFAPAGQAQTIGTSRFLPEGYRGVRCRALKPGCMSKSQWAKQCRSRFLFRRPDPSAMSQSCRDALDLHPTGVRVLDPAPHPPGLKPPLGTNYKKVDLPPTPEPPVTFLPENFPDWEARCIAITPSCMKRSEWAKLCASWKRKDPNYVLDKSCRVALAVRPVYIRPHYARPHTTPPKQLIPIPQESKGSLLE